MVIRPMCLHTYPHHFKHRGYAYESQGSVYFRVSKFEQYGKLANLDFKGMVDGAGEVSGQTNSKLWL